MSLSLASKIRKLSRLYLAIPRALRQAWRNPPTYPLEIQFEHTSRCNLQCVMCVHGHGTVEKRPDMSRDLFVGLLDQLKGPEAAPGFDRLRSVSLQGVGEPMLHKHVIEMIQYARGLGLHTYFISNMTVMNEKLAEALVLAGHGTIIASVDSVDPAVFADIRRGARYELLGRVLNSMRILQEMKRRHGKDRPVIEVASLLMKRTVDGAPELVRTLREVGVSKIIFQDVDESGIPDRIVMADGSRANQQSILDWPRERRLALMARLKSMETQGCQIETPEEHGAVTHWQRPDAVQTCEDLWEKPFVTVEGIVTPCCFAPFKDQLPMGDLNTQRFEEIWFGPAYQALRMRHLTGRPPRGLRELSPAGEGRGREFVDEAGGHPQCARERAIPGHACKDLAAGRRNRRERRRPTQCQDEGVLGPKGRKHGSTSV